jgi:hypothetical protein
VVAPTLLPNGGGFQIAVTGDALSTTIQATTNLITGPWLNLFTGTPPFTYIDTSAVNYSTRFYRAITGP